MEIILGDWDWLSGEEKDQLDLGKELKKEDEIKMVKLTNMHLVDY